MTLFRFTPGFTAPLALLTALACSGSDLVLPSANQTWQLKVVRGDGQVGTAGATLGTRATVQLVDEAGEGIPNQAVAWVVSLGGGSVDPEAATTDSAGFAAAQWTLGPSLGPNALDAGVPGVETVTFIAQARDGDAGPSATTSTVSADPTSIQEGSGTSTIRVTVRDGVGAPVSGATVSLSASGTGNTLTQPAGPTGSDGVATGTLRSTVPGTKDVTATVNGSVQLNQTAQVSVMAAPPPPPPPPPSTAEVHHLVFQTPPRDVERNDEFTLRVALVNAAGSVVPLSGIDIYVGIFREGDDSPSNKVVVGERMQGTQSGIATFTLRINDEGRYRFRALTDELPQFGQGGPQPYLFSAVFEVD